MEVYINQLISGITWSAQIFLISVGFVLIFSVLKVVNFAHGALYMLGAFMCYFIWHWLGETGLSFWFALPISALIVGAIGLPIELLLRPLYKRELSDQLILTLGLVFIINDLVRMKWGGSLYSVARPRALAGTIKWGQLLMPTYNFFIVVVVFCFTAGLWLLLTRTRLGLQIRAASFDRRMASILGIRLPLLYTGVFCLGSLLAGVVGAISAPLTLVTLGLDEIIVPVAAVVIMGGMGSIMGAAVASLVLGIVYSFGVMFIPQFSTAIMFAVVCIVMIVRPYGIFGRA